MQKTTNRHEGQGLSIFDGKSALVVEDYQEMRKTLKKMLQGFGIERIDEAVSGQEAIRNLETRYYDIVLCDFSFGDAKNGQQVLEEAKYKDLIGYSTIFIMVTAEASASWVMGAVEHQPDDYLVKPFTRDVLRLRLERQIRKKRDLHEIEEAINGQSYNNAIKLCEAKLASEPKNRYEIMRIKSDLQMRVGDYDGAIATYKEVVRRHPLVWARLGLGKAFLYQGDTNHAMRVFVGIKKDTPTCMQAYDWIARIYEMQGRRKEAKEILQEGIEVSPMSITRQQALGHAAYYTGDYMTAERSYRSAVKLGRHSTLKKASDYSHLAKSLAHQGSDVEAVRTLRVARGEFNHDSRGIYETATAEGLVYKKMHRLDEATRALNEAKEILQRGSIDEVDTDSSLEFAQTCFDMGDDELALSVMRKVITNHYEEPRVLDQIRAVFKKSGKVEAGSALIEDVRREMVALNNRGVQLVKDGYMLEAIDFFLEAAEGLSGNKTINLNAAQILIRYMRDHGPDPNYLRKVERLLQKVENIDPRDERYLNLLKKAGELSH